MSRLRAGLGVAALAFAAVGCDETSSSRGHDAAVSSPEQPSTTQGVRRRIHAAVGGSAADAGNPPSQQPLSDGGTKPAPEPEPEPASPTAQLILSDAPLTSSLPQTRTTFSINALSELYVYTRWSNLVGEHTERRQFIQPSGDVYYQKLLAFSNELDQPVPFTRAVDIPHGTQVLPVSARADGTLILEDYIGVTGTWIADHAITGQWKVEVYLDGAEQPIATHMFELTP